MTLKLKFMMRKIFSGKMSKICSCFYTFLRLTELEKIDLKYKRTILEAATVHKAVTAEQTAQHYFIPTEEKVSELFLNTMIVYLAS